MKESKSKEQPFEPRHDGWMRFERAVDAAVKSGPKHRPAIDRAKRKFSASLKQRKRGSS